MRGFCITTDSNSDLPQSMANKLNTIVVPLYYSFSETVYGGELQMPPAEFYERMRNGQTPNSQPNDPVIVEEMFRAVLNAGLDIIHISFSSALSESYKIVCAVAKKLSEEYRDYRISVIDSQNVSLGEALLVIQANNLRLNGASYEETITQLESFKNHINVEFTVDDLAHLQRGERVSKTTAVVGKALSLKPFLYVNNKGGISPSGNARGRKKAMQTLVDRMKVSMDPSITPTLPMGIVHGNCLNDAIDLQQMIKEQIGIKEIIINDINPSIGVHSGPGALAIAYYGKLKPGPKEL